MWNCSENYQCTGRDCKGLLDTVNGLGKEEREGEERRGREGGRGEGREGGRERRGGRETGYLAFLLRF